MPRRQERSCAAAATRVHRITERRRAYAEQSAAAATPRVRHAPKRTAMPPLPR